MWRRIVVGVALVVMATAGVAGWLVYREVSANLPPVEYGSVLDGLRAFCERASEDLGSAQSNPAGWTMLTLSRIAE